MLFHPIEGCPTNSNCTKRAAFLRKKWIQLIKTENLPFKKKLRVLEKFKDQYGILLSIWASPLGARDRLVISWRSQCSHHTNKGKEEVYMAETFIKNIKSKIKNHDNKFIPQKHFF